MVTAGLRSVVSVNGENVTFLTGCQEDSRDLHLGSPMLPSIMCLTPSLVAEEEDVTKLSYAHTLHTFEMSS